VKILTCGVCQTDSLNIYVDEEHFTEPGHQRAMLTMGEMIADFVKEHKKVSKMVDKTLRKEEERRKRVAEVERRREEERKRREEEERNRPPEPEIVVVKEQEAEIKVMDSKKAPFLYTSHLLVCFDLKLTDHSWASEIYQIGARTVSSQYSTYILPHGRVNWDVTEEAGVKIRESAGGSGGKKLVTCEPGNPGAIEKERPLQVQLPWYGYSSFLDWIRGQKEKGNYEKVLLVAHNNSAMPALLNKFATENLLPELQGLVDCFATYMPYLRKYHPELGEDLKVDALTPRLLPEMTVKPHDAKDSARRCFLILQKLGEPDVVEKLLEREVPMDKAIELSQSILAKAMEKNAKRAKGKNKSMALILPSLCAL